MLVVARKDKALRTPVKKFLASEERPDGFFVNIHPGARAVHGRRRDDQDRRPQSREGMVGGVSYLVSPTAFFQTNVGAAEQLVNLVLEEVGAAKTVLDLYCGTGCFRCRSRSRREGDRGRGNRQAIADAEANVRLNRMPPGQIRFIAARVEDALARVGKEPWDAVVLDPPRQGCPPGCCAVFERIRPARAVYVSCNPDALAKELPVILKTGYRVTRMQPVDMFPHTDHIETVMAFERG